MSDSHVNDIRYTALWRPLIKPRVNHLLPASFFRLLWQSLYIGTYTWNLVEARWNFGDYLPELVETWTGFSRNGRNFAECFICELVTNEIEFSRISLRNILFLNDTWYFKIDFYFNTEILFKFIVVLKIFIIFLKQNKYNVSMRLTFY